MLKFYKSRRKVKVNGYKFQIYDTIGKVLS